MESFALSLSFKYRTRTRLVNVVCPVFEKACNDCPITRNFYVFRTARNGRKADFSFISSLLQYVEFFFLCVVIFMMLGVKFRKIKLMKLFQSSETIKVSR